MTVKLIASDEIQGVQPIVYSEEELSEFRKVNPNFQNRNLQRTANGKYIEYIKSNNIHTIFIILSYGKSVIMYRTENFGSYEEMNKVFEKYLKEGA